jgi:glycosyltransferase involved in cell wall biosynthesis
VDQPYFPRRHAPWLAPIYRLLFAIPARIICNSAAVKAAIAEYGIAPGKIDVIPAFSRQYLEFEPVTLSTDLESLFARFRAIVFTYIRIRPGFDLATLLDAFASVARERPDVGLVFAGVCEDVDPTLWEDVESRLERHAIRDRVCVVGDLDHDAFLTTVSRSSVYVRTPVSDGVASSVLEALALRVPVLASDNGTRPRGVVTYAVGNAAHLAERLAYVLAHRDDISAAAPIPDIRDTLADEVCVLTRQPIVRAGLEDARVRPHGRSSEA